MGFLFEYHTYEKRQIIVEIEYFVTAVGKKFCDMVKQFAVDAAGHKCKPADAPFVERIGPFAVFIGKRYRKSVHAIWNTRKCILKTLKKTIHHRTIFKTYRYIHKQIPWFCKNAHFK